MSDPILSIFARWPRPGHAKTRLIPQFGPQGAADIYQKLLIHTLDTARASALDFEVRITGANPDQFCQTYGDDLRVIDQGEGGLSEKLTRITAPALIIGSDCPGLDATLLNTARDALRAHDAVIGPAEDGGYYLLGFKKPAPFAFSDMPWSTDTVCRETMTRFTSHGFSLATLPPLGDIDTPQDLVPWPAFLP